MLIGDIIDTGSGLGKILTFNRRSGSATPEIGEAVTVTVALELGGTETFDLREVLQIKFYVGDPVITPQDPTLKKKEWVWVGGVISGAGDVINGEQELKVVLVDGMVVQRLNKSVRHIRSA